MSSCLCTSETRVSCPENVNRGTAGQQKQAPESARRSCRGGGRFRPAAHLQRQRADARPSTKLFKAVGVKIGRPVFHVEHWPVLPATLPLELPQSSARKAANLAEQSGTTCYSSRLCNLRTKGQWIHGKATANQAIGHPTQWRHGTPPRLQGQDARS